MGTLFDQRPRSDKLASITRAELGEMLAIMGVKGKPTIEEWTCAARMLEAGLKLQGADVLDEQLAGFGELFRELIECLDTFLHKDTLSLLHSSHGCQDVTTS